MDSAITATYGDKVRVRVCGLCWDDDKLLMVRHSRLNKTGFWAPPGGGVEFGLTVQENLKREFVEETGIQIEVGNFRFTCEFIRAPLHSIELFFEATKVGGDLCTGSDPELQIISDVRFMTMEEIKSIPHDQVHGVFGLVNGRESLRKLGGFYRI